MLPSRKFAVPALAALALLFASACRSPSTAGGEGGFGPVSPDAPEWVKTGEVAGYPAGAFILARGVSSPEHTESDALALARVNAQTQISEQIVTRVESELKSIQRQVSHDGKLESFENFDIFARQETSELLAGAEKVKEWYDPKTGVGYAFLAMNRISLSERLLNQAADKKKAALGQLEAAKEAEAAKDYGSALKSLVHARRAVAVALSNHAKAIAVGTTKEIKRRFDVLDLGVLWNEVTKEYESLAGAVRLLPESGNEQVASLSGTVRKPIVVRVTGPGGSPVAGFPVRVRLPEKAEGKAAVIPHADATDPAGRFSFDLKELKATGSHGNSITVSLDYAAVEPRSALAPPSCTVTYLMPTRETTRIAVVVYETVDGRENPDSITASFIKKALTDLGFQVIRPDLGGRPAEQVVRMSPRELERLVGDQCDYLIAGRAESAFSSNDTFTWYKTRLVVDALELESGKTIHFEIPMGQSTKGGSPRKNQAIRESLRKAARVLVGGNKPGDEGLLGRKFVARFESGAAWEK